MDERIAGLASYYGTVEAASVLLSDLGLAAAGATALEAFGRITDVDRAVTLARHDYPWAPTPVPHEPARWRALRLALCERCKALADVRSVARRLEANAAKLSLEGTVEYAAHTLVMEAAKLRRLERLEESVGVGRSG